MSSNSLAVEAVANTGGTPQAPSKDDALAGLTKYIPTETITLYIAAVSAEASIDDYGLTSELSYWIFVLATPAFMLLLYLRQLAMAQQNWKISVTQWPWWRMIASTLAFSVWALAIPGNPIITSSNETGGVIAGFAALLVSMVLNLFSPFFEKAQPAAP